MKEEYKVDSSCNNTSIDLCILFCVNLDRDINGGQE